MTRPTNSVHKVLLNGRVSFCGMDVEKIDNNGFAHYRTVYDTDVTCANCRREMARRVKNVNTIMEQLAADDERERRRGKKGLTTK